MKTQIKPGVAVAIVVAVILIVGVLGWKLTSRRSGAADLATIEAENRARSTGLPSGGPAQRGPMRQGMMLSGGMTSGGGMQGGVMPSGGATYSGGGMPMQSGGYGAR